MKKRISILSILLLLGMTVYAQTDIPQVIPSLQHWNGAKGKLTLPETTITGGTLGKLEVSFTFEGTYQRPSLPGYGSR